MKTKKRMLNKEERMAQGTMVKWSWFFGWTGWIMSHASWVFDNETNIIWPAGLGLAVSISAVAVGKLFEMEYKP
jgi:hypothetical protein